MAEKPAGKDEPTIDIETFARLAGEPEVEVRRLARSGALPPSRLGKLPLARSIQKYIAYVKEDHASDRVVGEEIGISADMIQLLVREGAIKRTPGRPGVSRKAAMVGYIHWLRDEGRRSTKAAAESRVREARAKDIEERMAIRRRELIPLDDAQAVLDFFLGHVRGLLQGLAARVTRDLSTRSLIETATNDILASVAQRAEESGVALVAGGPSIEAEPADDPGRVGEPQPRLS